MNSMIENLTIDMRALGIRSLAIELRDEPGEPVEVPLRIDERPTQPPEVEPEFRGDPNQCAMVGCGEPNGGILGGKLKAYCRKHAFAQTGIK